MDAATTACSNAGFGESNLSALTTGCRNIAMGHSAAYVLTTGNENVALGGNSLYLTTTGSNNTVVGYSAFYDNTTGANNTALGWYALADNTTASNNTALGYYAMRACTTGTTNVAVGGSAGQAITTGSEILHIGQNAGTSPTTSNGTSCIGYNANSTSATVNHEMTLGNANLGTLRCQQTSISALSDERDKADIADLPAEAGLDFINKLKPRTFYWDMRDWYDDGVSDGSKKNTTHRSWKANSGQRMGFISQEIQTAISGLKYMEDSKVVSGTTEKLEFAPAHLITPLIKAVQQLSAENKLLIARIEVLEGS